VIYLLDNNVLSEWWKPQPDPNVLAWMESAPDWFLPAPVLSEIQEGAERHASQARRVELNAMLDQFLSDFPDVVLPWDKETARVWGRLKHSPEVKRQPQPLWDSLIDAMAVRYSAIIATRNAADFRHGKTFNPWLKELPR
jgi:predicted nucleic acid-binding protein